MVDRQKKKDKQHRKQNQPKFYIIIHQPHQDFLNLLHQVSPKTLS